MARKCLGLDQARGRTVLEVVDVGDHAALLFSDDTALVVKPVLPSYSDRPELEFVVGFDPNDARDFGYKAAIEHGLIDQADWDAHVAEEAKKRAEKQEQSDREEYERLKAKYEPK